MSATSVGPALRSLVLLSLLFIVLTPTDVTAQGLTARVAPEYSHLRWGGDVGLEGADLFGGAVSMGFGRYVGLRAGYKTASDVPTALAATGYGAGSPEENRVRASLFSTDVLLRLGSGRFAPVLLGSGGVLGFSPDGRPRVRQVAVGYGAGIDARILPWLDGQVLLQDLRFRLDRSTIAGDTAGVGAPTDPNAADLWSTIALTASLGARLGGARSSTRADELDQDVGRALSGGEGLLVPVELHAGVLRFDNGLALADRALAGVRAGVDLGPYFGLRGSYARGVQGGFGSLAAMSSWSGEAQFNVGRVTGASPHLLVGFGQLSFWGDYRDQNGVRPVDQGALILGVGFGAPLDDRARLVVTLRDYVTTASSVSGVSTTTDLRHSFGLTGGISYLVRGRRTARGPSPPGPAGLPRAGGVLPAAAASSGQPAPPAAVAAGAGAVAPAAGTALATTQAPAGSAASGATISGVPSEDAATGVPTNYQSQQVVTIPVPVQGELYVRYGPTGSRPGETQAAAPPAPIVIATPYPGALSPTAPPGLDSLALARAVQAAVSASAGAVTRSDLEEMEQRLALRMDGSVTRDLASLEARLADRMSGVEQRAGADRDRSDLDVLSRRVEELAALIRAREATPAFQPVPVVVTSDGTAVVLANESRAPLFRGAGFKAGTSWVRDSRTGFGAGLDVALGGALGERLHPYVGAELARTPVRGTLGTVPYSGSVSSYGASAGASLGLVRVSGVQTALDVSLVGIGGGTSGDDASGAAAVDQLYGGFVMGPRAALDLGWRWSPASRLQARASIAHLWAGARGGWSVQLGLRWRRASVYAAPRPFVSAGAPMFDVVERVRADTAVAEPALEPPPPPVNPEILDRLSELEAALSAERAARERSQAVADSLQADARAAQIRAQLLAAEAAEVATRQREAAAVDDTRARVREELEALVGVVENVQAVRTSERGLHLVLGGTLFPPGSSTLSPAARAGVQRVGMVLNRAEGYLLTVDGHTDGTGAEATNLVISRLRAQAVRDVLLDVGIGSERITVVGSGELNPIASNETPEGRARNRRVEIVVEGLLGR